MNLAEVCSARNANVGLLAYSPMAGGVLSGKYLHPDSTAAQKGRLHLFKGFMDRYKTSRAQVRRGEGGDMASMLWVRRTSHFQGLHGPLQDLKSAGEGCCCM